MVNISLFLEQLVYALAMTGIMDLDNLILVICLVDNFVSLCDRRELIAGTGLQIYQLRPKRYPLFVLSPG